MRSQIPCALAQNQPSHLFAILPAIVLIALASNAFAQVCGDPASGDCCDANGTPGCDDDACCTLVCGGDPFCCAGVWDATCAATAAAVCSNGCPSCPGEGDCCVDNGSPSCDDAACCDTVCAIDPFCCAIGANGVWDTTCASLAAVMCAPGTCSGDCPGEGECCEANGTPGCDDPACCSAVCTADPACCATVWDESCAATAAAVCSNGCPGVCPGDGDCCVANGTPSCDDAACCATVCGIDPVCCTTVWDASCAALAAANCAAGTCPGVCPGDGDCCAANGTPSCDDPDCCAAVCGVDPACCSTVWDEACAATAAAVCSNGCPACPGEGDCCDANGTPSCDDASCCDTVCAIDPFCCAIGANGVWDTTCASLAAVMCAPGTCPGDCPGEGECCEANGTPGCDDPACCSAVCTADPACCATVWDESCAATAAAVCSNGCPGVCPGDGDCCVANGTPSCDDAACCATVCGIDPDCCSTVWDDSCAVLAALNCAPGTCPGVCPGEGDCCVENGTPACEDPACCSLVCGLDPDCCAITWDEGCGALAKANCGLCRGDFDNDGDVDLVDFANLADCLDGPILPPTPTPPTSVLQCLDAFDFDVDGDVDLDDVADFTIEFTG